MVVSPRGLLRADGVADESREVCGFLWYAVKRAVYGTAGVSEVSLLLATLILDQGPR